MNTREKARYLITHLFNNSDHITWEEAKQFALFTCDEIINFIAIDDIPIWATDYWNNVKEEIKKL